MSDAVNHPSHYNRTPIEAITVMEAVCRSGASRSPALKYLAQVGGKDPAHEDLGKAAWYTRRLVTADHGDFTPMDYSRASEVALTWANAANVKSISSSPGESVRSTYAKDIISEAIFALLTGCDMILTYHQAKWTVIADKLERLAEANRPTEG